jgi:hypothetical protein
MITLISVFYYICEMLFHGAWDMYFQYYYGHIKNKLNIILIHEGVDLFTVFTILIIVKISAMN